MIRFWADWCPFCKGEMTALEPVYQRLRDQGLQILAVNVRQDAQTAKALRRQLGISYDTLLDSSGEVARAYGVQGLPTTFFVGRDGTRHNRILGESTPELTERLVSDLLGRAVSGEFGYPLAFLTGLLGAGIAWGCAAAWPQARPCIKGPGGDLGRCSLSRGTHRHLCGPRVPGALLGRVLVQTGALGKVQGLLMIGRVLVIVGLGLA